MAPQEFNQFRDHLNPASGFQSVQFRELEFACGLRRMDEAQAAGEALDTLEMVDDAIDEVLGRTNDVEDGDYVYEQPQSASAPSTTPPTSTRSSTD